MIMCGVSLLFQEPKSLITKAMMKIKVRRRFGLTGTALQNNLKELWCLLNWANPGCLGKWKRFAQDFVKPLEQGQKHDVVKRELAQARKKKDEFRRIRDKWLLRRTKAFIADQLPRKG